VGSQTFVSLSDRQLRSGGASGVAVLHQLGDGLVIDSVDANLGSYDPATGIWTVGELANGGGGFVTIYVTVAETGAYTTQAAITASSRPDPNETNNTAELITLTPNFSADLSLFQAVGDATPVVGSQTFVSLQIGNNGPAAASDVVVSHQLGDGLVIDSVDANLGTSYDPATGIWTVGELAYGVVRIADGLRDGGREGPYTTVAAITASSRPDPNESNNSVELITLVPNYDADLYLSQSVGNQTPVVGSQTWVSLSVGSYGPAVAGGVAVAHQMGAGLVIDSVDASSGTSYDLATGVWTVGELGYGDSASLTVYVTVAESGPYTTVAAITGSSRPDPNESNNSAELITLAPNYDADLYLSQSVGNQTPVVGSQTWVSLSVGSYGPAVAGGVAVAHQLGAGLVIDSVDASPGTSYDPSTGVWTVGELGYGDYASLTVYVTVAESGPYTTVAAITASSRPDPNESNNSVELITLAPNYDADLYLSQSVGNQTPVVGSQTWVSLAVGSYGPAVASGVAVAHQLGAGLMIDSVEASAGTSYDSGSGLWTVGELGYGDNASLTVYVTVAESGPYTTVAAITASSRPDSIENNNSTGLITLTPSEP
jgi:large repetitive protein